MHVHSACHTGAPLTAAYQDGVLIISCYICDREVIRVAVADTPEHPSLYLEPLTPPSVN